MAVKSIKFRNVVWHNVTEFDLESFEWLKKHFKFHPLNIRDCQGENEHPKVDYYRDYFFAVLHFPEINKIRNLVYGFEVDIFVGKDLLITVQKQKNKTLNNIFYRLTTNKHARQEYMQHGSGFLLYKITEKMYKQFVSATGYVYSRLSAIEKEIFENESTATAPVKTLADIRRMVLKLRLVLDPQRIVVTSIQKAKYSFFSDELDLYFDDIRDFLEKMWSVLENQKDLITGIYETNESLVSQRTNRIIQILTIFSVSMLPLTLFTGIYGMNIDLPGAHNTLYVWTFFGGLALIILLVILYFRRKDLI